MYVWENDRSLICSQISDSFKKFKIILKTKNDIFFIKRWVNHHAGQDIGIIIFDNNSSDPDVLSYYKTLPEDVLLVQYSGLHRYGGSHNTLHDVETFSDLYLAIQKSCSNFCFLDTDEFLSYTDGSTFYPPKEFFNFKNSIFNDGINFTLYLYNKSLSDKVFEFGSVELLKDRLKWGKPIIGSADSISGFINHNIQIRNHVSNRGGLRFVTFHLTNLSPVERMKANLRKLVVRKILAPDATLEDALVFRLKLLNPPEEPLVLIYLDEIFRLSQMVDSEPDCMSVNNLIPGHLMLQSISEVSEAIYLSNQEGDFFKDVISGDVEIVI